MELNFKLHKYNYKQALHQSYRTMIHQSMLDRTVVKCSQYLISYT